MGYHRLNKHRSDRVPLILEYFFALCGTLALERGPIFWVATHRIHHHKPDQPGDPHSPREGAWRAHVGWIVFGDPDQSKTATMSRCAPGVAKHRFYIWLNEYHWFPHLCSA
jgi:fatty-acid desaturase